MPIQYLERACPLVQQLTQLQWISERVRRPVLPHATPVNGEASLQCVPNRRNIRVVEHSDGGLAPGQDFGSLQHDSKTAVTATITTNTSVATQHHHRTYPRVANEQREPERVVHDKEGERQPVNNGTCVLSTLCGGPFRRTIHHSTTGVHVQAPRSKASEWMEGHCVVQHPAIRHELGIRLAARRVRVLARGNLARQQLQSAQQCAAHSHIVVTTYQQAHQWERSNTGLQAPQPRTFGEQLRDIRNKRPSPTETQQTPQ
jgi:hypothetical protein